MPVLGQTPVRTHWEDSESVTFEKIGATYTDPNDSTKLVQDVMAHANLGRVRSDATASATVDQDDMGYSVVLDDASPSVPIAASLDSSVDDRFMCFVLNESTQTATLTPTSGDINDGTGAVSSKTLAAGTSCALFKTSLGSPAVAHWKMLKGAGSGGGSSPLTTKGDIYTHDSADARLAVGSNGQFLVADSAQTKGVKWANIAESDVTNLTTDLAAKVPTSRNINTTAPITGGGDLSADRTLAISDFTGDSGSGGAKGAVPAPASGDAAAGKFLKASGAWAVPPSGMTNPMTTQGDIIYGGSSGTPTRLAAGTSGLVLTSNGSGSAPSYQAVGSIGLPDWLKNHPDAYPASANAEDDEFDNGATINAAWTDVNAAASTVFTQANGRLIATPSSDNGAAFRGKYKSLPGSGSWEYRAKVVCAPNAVTASFNFAGVMIYESSSGKAVVYYFGRNSDNSFQIKLDKWTSSGGAFGSNINAGTAVGESTYFKIQFDGTNYIYSASTSGLTFVIGVAARAATTDFTTKADRIALVSYSNQGSASEARYFEWFRRIV